MAQILPRDLTPIPGGTVNPAAAIIIDNEDGVFKGTPANVVDAGAPINSQAEAQAGLVNTGRMTPLRVSQAIAALGLSQAVLASTNGAGMVGTPEGVSVETSLTAALVGPGAFGEVGTDAERLAALTGALSAKGSGGSLLMDQDLDLGTTPPANPGIDVVGEFVASFDNGDGQGNQVWNKAGRSLVEGRLSLEQLFVWYNRIRTFSTGTTVKIIGDSNAEGRVGALLATILRGIPGVTVTNYGVSGSTIRNWLDNTGTVNGTGKNSATVLATAAPTLCIFAYGGTNEPYFGRTLAQYDADLTAAMTAIRAAWPARTTSLMLLSANTQGEGSTGQDELFIHRARRFQVREALRVKAAWFDKLKICPDASMDYGAGANQNTVLDSFRVHTENWLTQGTAFAIAEAIIPKGFGARAVLGEHPVVPFADKPAIFSDTITGYPKGGAITQRATSSDGWSIDGFVTTVSSADGTGGCHQTLWSYSSPLRAVRHWTGAAWSLFVANGLTAMSGNAVLATAITSYIAGDTVQRCIPADGWPLDGFVKTCRESVLGSFGYQETWAYNSAAPHQRRTFISGTGWTAWSAMW